MQITSVTNGGRPVSPDNRGPQSVHISGNGFINGMGFFIQGPSTEKNPTGSQRVVQPSIQNITDTDCDAVIDFSLMGTYAICIGIPPADVDSEPIFSDWYNFPVKGNI